MPVSPPFDPPITVPDYWSLSTLSFNRSQDYPNNPEYHSVFPNEIRSYDINGDGYLDILLVYSYIPPQERPGIPIRVLLGGAQGNFVDGTATLFPNGVPLGDAASTSSVADFNGDGVLDIYIAMTWETLATIERRDVLLLSDGQGGVVDASDTLPDINDYTHWTAAADIDGDGDIDIYSGNLGEDRGEQGDFSPFFLINDGTGQFTRSDMRLPATIENGFRSYTSCLLFDADNDGDADLLLGMWGTEAQIVGTGGFSNLILFNNGTGFFAESSQSNLPAPLYDVTRATMLDMEAIDLNGDGFADLLMLTSDDYAQNAVQVLINNGDGTFRDETQMRLPIEDSLNNGSRFLHLADVNADGAIDLVLQTGGPTRFFLNDGTGHFVALPDDFLFTNSSSGGYAFVPGDFNGDGRTDFFVRTIVNDWDDPNDVTEFHWIALWDQPNGASLSGDASNNALLGIAIAETLSGLGGDDVIFGGGGADTITGDAGADILVGGAGSDQFRDSVINLSGDTIRDLAAGDRIIFTNASLDGFTISLSGGTLIYTGGTLNLPNGLTGRDLVISAAPGGGVQLTVVTDAVRNDFNGDGRSDILWRSTSGQFSDWLATPAGGWTNNDANAFTTVPTNWQVTATGDFNGDGFADVLWRSDSGQFSNWLGQANGGFANNDANAFTTVPTNWIVVGTGDFNGDGRDDVLWRSQAGQVSNWLGTASGSFANNDGNAFASVPTNWIVVGTGDFNGDGRDDILWRSTSGQLSNWLGTATGGWTTNDANAFTSAPTSWHVVGTGDFNGDGRDDILWRSDAGQLSNWLATATGGWVNNDANAFTTVPINWQVVATGDYNGDGFDDILWRSDTGQLSNWLGTATGGFTNNDANAFTSAPTNWETQPDNFIL